MNTLLKSIRELPEDLAEKLFEKALQDKFNEGREAERKDNSEGKRYLKPDDRTY